MSEILEGAEQGFDKANGYRQLEQQLPEPDEQLSAEAIEAIGGQFHYRTEVDQDGLTRQVYEYGQTSFSFAGREETPIYPSLENSRPSRLGQEPWHARQLHRSDDYADIIGRQTSYEPMLASIAQKNLDQAEHLVVERSAYGIYLLLSKLQPENPHWKQQADAIRGNQYDDEVLTTIDIATAVNAFYTQERVEGRSQPTLGEIVAVAACLGDTRAQQIAEQALALQRDREAAVIQRQQELVAGSYDINDGVEAFTPSDLVVVHSARFKPAEVDGGYTVSTTHDATGFPRSSVHTSLNHKVENDVWYGFDEADYVLVCGLDQMLARNGAPKSLNGADTWWSRNPGEPLMFPGAVLIMPGGDQIELVVDEPNGRRKYKSEGLTQVDIDEADTIMPGTRDQIAKALNGPQGEDIPIESSQGQRIIANVLRDALVQQEISVKRRLALEAQHDDKFMKDDFNRRVYKMAAELKLPLTDDLHRTSEEADVEIALSNGLRRDHISDPKVRRVAYASGFTDGGGSARQESLRKRTAKRIPGA
jgi:hypothetical protein